MRLLFAMLFQHEAAAVVEITHVRHVRTHDEQSAAARFFEPIFFARVGHRGRIKTWALVDNFDPHIVGRALQRQFNLLAGWTPEEDTLPERFLNTPLPNDPEASLSRERLDALVAEYHVQRGW